MKRPQRRYKGIFDPTKKSNATSVQWTLEHTQTCRKNQNPSLKPTIWEKDERY